MLSLLLIASVFTACSSNDSNSNSLGSNNAVEETGETKKTIDFWYPGGNQEIIDYWDDTVKAFEEENPDIKIITTITPANAQEIETKLNAAKMSGTYPDVFVAYLAFMGTRGSRGEFTDLSPYIDSWDGKSDVFEAAFQAGQYQGKTYGIGFQPNPEMLVYRKDYFEEAGLDPEQPPQTWEELASYAEKLVKRDESGNVIRAGMDIPALTPATVFLDIFMRQNGSMIIDEVNGKPAFTDENSIEALQYLVDLHDKNVSIPFDFQKRSESPFFSGRAAMGFLSPAHVGSIIQNNPELEDQIGFVPLMTKKEKVSFTGWQLFTIGSESEVKDEAWKFIEFAMSPEQVWKRYEETKTPVVLNSLVDKFMEDDPDMHEVVTEYIMHGKGKAVTTFTSLANKHLALAYEEAMNNQKSPEQALNDAQHNLEEELNMMK